MKVLFFTMIWLAAVLWWGFADQILFPAVGRDVALSQVNGGEVERGEVQTYQAMRGIVPDLGFLVAGMYSLALYWPFAKRHAPPALLLAVVSLAMSGGCVKPYPGERVEEIKNNETAFVIPLEGDLAKQVKFQSIEFLEKAKVSAKRVILPLRWKKTGRWRSNGEWIPTITVVRVSRAPVNREWTADPKTGTAGKDQAIWVESADSVGFAVGFGCTAQVLEEDTARFLYYYPSGSLDAVMDGEIRERVQAAVASRCAAESLDTLRAQKNDILKAVRETVEPYAKTRGITINTISMKEGFRYENPKIQTAIDNVFVAQQEKNTAKATLEAQADKNARVNSEALALAEKARREAKGQADALREINRAAQEAQQNPLFLELKKLEVETNRIQKWDGRYPQWYMAPEGKTGLLMSVPSTGSAN